MSKCAGHIWFLLFAAGHMAWALGAVYQNGVVQPPIKYVRKYYDILRHTLTVGSQKKGGNCRARLHCEIENGQNIHEVCVLGFVCRKKK